MTAWCSSLIVRISRASCVALSSCMTACWRVTAGAWRGWTCAMPTAWPCSGNSLQRKPEPRDRNAMANVTNDKMFVALDIGTSKVVAIVGQTGMDGSMEIVGIGSHPSKGMRRGVVVDIEATVKSIQRAVEEAELMAGVQVHSVYAGIAGSHIRSLNSHGMVALRDRAVPHADIARAMGGGQGGGSPAAQNVLHILRQECSVDHRGGVRGPLGMSGGRLDAKVRLVTCAVNAAQNIEK